MTYHNYSTLQKNNTTLCSLQKRELPVLRKLIKKNKIANLVNNYWSKLKRNNIYSKPVEFTPFIDLKKSWIDRLFGTIEGK